jgi:hypothetical protein
VIVDVVLHHGAPNGNTLWEYDGAFEQSAAVSRRPLVHSAARSRRPLARALLCGGGASGGSSPLFLVHVGEGVRRSCLEGCQRGARVGVGLYEVMAAGALGDWSRGTRLFLVTDARCRARGCCP